jgi:hypothetical protein
LFIANVHCGGTIRVLSALLDSGLGSRHLLVPKIVEALHRPSLSFASHSRLLWTIQIIEITFGNRHLSSPAPNSRRNGGFVKTDYGPPYRIFYPRYGEKQRTLTSGTARLRAVGREISDSRLIRR